MIATGNHNFERFAALCNTLPGEAGGYEPPLRVQWAYHPIKKRRPGGRTGAALWQTVASRGDICLPKKRIDNRDKKSKRKSSKQRKEYGSIRVVSRRLHELKIYERIVNRMSDVGVANLATRAAKPPWLP